MRYKTLLRPRFEAILGSRLRLTILETSHEVKQISSLASQIINQHELSTKPLIMQQYIFFGQQKSVNHVIYSCFGLIKK